MPARRPRKRKPTKKEAWAKEYHSKIGLSEDTLREVYDDLRRKAKRRTA